MRIRITVLAVALSDRAPVDVSDAIELDAPSAYHNADIACAGWRWSATTGWWSPTG